jgi:hypothetical protein
VSLDSLPGGQHDDRQQERGQGDEGHRDAVHHQVVGDAEALDPGKRLAVDQVAEGFEAPCRRESPEDEGRGQGEVEQGDRQRVDSDPVLGLVAKSEER